MDTATRETTSVPEFSEALVMMDDPFHVVRMVVAQMDGALTIRGDWRHVNRDHWRDVPPGAVAGMIRGLALEIGNAEDLWAVVQAVDRYVSWLAKEDRLEVLTGCR
jgi:hypothetical protein